METGQGQNWGCSAKAKKKNYFLISSDSEQARTLSRKVEERRKEKREDENDERKTRFATLTNTRRNRLSVPMMSYRPSGTRTFGVEHQVGAV
jgi:hypothetical protein